MPESTDWSLLGAQMGFGGLLGFAVGYAVKKALKVALVLLGILVVLIVSLEGYGFITVNWPEIEGAYLRAMEQTGGMRGFFTRWAESFATLIPVTGSFTVGFFFGLRRG